MEPALLALLRDDATLHPVEHDIRSLLAPGGVPSHYDALADGYDRLIGNRWHQRITWGNHLRNEVGFALEAVGGAAGVVLDVGCGSLLFTADVHGASGRPSLLLDLSLGMLRRGAERLVARFGRVPPHLALVQADALALPLHSHRSDTVLCPGILHLFDDPVPLLRSLSALLAPGGTLFVSCLVTDRIGGRVPLRLLERWGEVGTPRSSKRVAATLGEVTGLPVSCTVVGNMAYLRAGRRA